VNIPEDALDFIDRQVATGKYRSRSEAITQAVYLLRDSSLHAAYLEAFSDIDPAWDTVVSDGVATDRW
jgi:Arc/MetJ-type ribon-helix-helix transcriptional regulator